MATNLRSAQVPVGGVNLITYGSLDAVLSDLGISHRADEKTEDTGRRVLEKDGEVLGRFTALEAWEWLKRQPL